MNLKKSTLFMNDQDVWHAAVAAITGQYHRLPQPVRAMLREKGGAICSAKEELHRLAHEMGSSVICASCGGECCLRGKYHFTVADLLIYRSTNAELFEPRFGRDFCPYLGDAGCLMQPSLRPFNCITFNCERVEGLWEPERIEEFYRRERELRRLYGELEAALGSQVRQGLLMSQSD